MQIIDHKNIILCINPCTIHFFFVTLHAFSMDVDNGPCGKVLLKIIKINILWQRKIKNLRNKTNNWSR